MRQVKNIAITEKVNANMAQGESLLKYWLFAFVALAWLCRGEPEGGEAHYVKQRYYTAPIMDSSHDQGGVNILHYLGII